MNVIDTAKEHARELAAKVLHTGDRQPTSQSITIGRPTETVTAFFQDPAALSQVFGDIADVEHTGPHRLRWTFLGQDDGTGVWECVVTADEHAVRFDDVRPDSTNRIVLEVREAPQGLGTEVLARVSSPAPGRLTAPLTYKALYRARALLHTGELPTIKHNPSARQSDR
jgi:uncharacterized membrane protein